MKLFLVLGCWGRTENGFNFCKGIENVILDLTNKSTKTNDMLNFLDSRYRLFDRPLYNNVHTALWNLQDKFGHLGNPVFDKVFFTYMEEFCILHKSCGTFLRFEMRKGEEEKCRKEKK